MTYWAILAGTVVVWLLFARQTIRQHRWHKRKAAQFAARRARMVEDLCWIYDRDEALRACMRATIRRAQDTRLQELGILRVVS